MPIDFDKIHSIYDVWGNSIWSTVHLLKKKNVWMNGLILVDRRVVRMTLEKYSKGRKCVETNSMNEN